MDLEAAMVMQKLSDEMDVEVGCYLTNTLWSSLHPLKLKPKDAEVVEQNFFDAQITRV